MGKLEMLDTVGVPEFYADHVGEMEDMGDGLMRVVKCIKRKGVLIPVYSFVAPATRFLTSDLQMIAFARSVLNMDARTH
jgi:hypothetical protein